MPDISLCSVESNLCEYSNKCMRHKDSKRYEPSQYQSYILIEKGKEGKNCEFFMELETNQ